MANKRTYFETTKKKNKKLLFFDKKCAIYNYSSNEEG